MERARKIDLDDFRRNRIASDMGVTVRVGSSQAACDSKNVARAAKRAQARALKYDKGTPKLGCTRAATRASSSGSASAASSKARANQRAGRPAVAAPAPAQALSQVGRSRAIHELVVFHSIQGQEGACYNGSRQSQSGVNGGLVIVIVDHARVA